MRHATDMEAAGGPQLEPPKRPNHADELASPHEPIHDVLMMALNTIPMVGPAAAMVAGRMWPDPGQAARDRFMIGLAERVDSLFEHKQIEEAFGRPEAPALLSHALNMASRSFGEKKLEALREATINGVFHSPADVDLTAVVFGVLERLTDGHITMIRALGVQQKSGSPLLRWENAKFAGLEFRYSREGMKEPESFQPDQIGVRYLEKASIRTAEIVLADLVDLGLVEERFGKMGSVYEWSTDPSNNLPGYAFVTAKGLLVLEHIEVVDQNATDN
jgi:hypothetical protein